MQPAESQLSENPAVRNGLIFGAILAAVNILNVFIQWMSGSYQAIAQASSGSTTTFTSGSLFGCLAFLAGLALSFIAGMNTVSVTGRLGSGAIAGLVTGVVGELVGGVLGLIVILALVLPNLPTPTSTNLTAPQIDGVIVGGALLGLVLGLVVDGVIGAGLGYLGGLVGKNNYNRPEALPPEPPASPSSS
ncbi:MAG: hypothetical protein ACLQUY_19025 [Ktedonobacterales bacterium]